MEHYIYKIINNINGKFYFGKRSCKGLAVNDTSYMGSGKLIQHAIKMYGKENFNKEILAYCESSEDALELEEMVVTQEEVNNPMCYNLKRGGDTGFLGGKHTDSTKLKFATYAKNHKHTDATKLKIKNSNVGLSRGKGKKLSQEHKNNISSSMMCGCPKINQYNLNGDLIKTWDSIPEIHSVLNFDKSSIRKCCIGKLKTSYGYIWEKIKEIYYE